MTLLNYSLNNPVKHTANFLKKKTISVFTKIQYIFGQEDHHLAQLLQKCTEEGRSNIEQMIALLAETCSKFCKNRTVFITTVVVFVCGMTELR